MSYTNTTIILCGLFLACCSFFTVVPAHAFTADSLDITISENGDALTTFHFTLEGFLENAIPQSVLEQELTKGLSSGPEPAELKSMDRSSAVLLMKKFADTSDVPTGKEYRTATMDFKKAEIALQNSAIGDAITADFSPATISLTFPDSYKKQYTNVDVLPAVFHTVEDPVKVARVQAQALADAQAQAQAEAQAQISPGATTTPVILTSSAAKGSINVTSSPPGVKISIDSQYIGESPALLQDITAGTHMMEFTKEGYSPVSKTVIVNAEKTTNIMVVLTFIPSAAATGEPASFPWLPVILVIVGLVVAGIGGYTYWTDRTRKEKISKPVRNGSTGIAGSGKPEYGKIIIKEPEIKNAGSGKPDTKKTVISEPETRIAGSVTPGTGKVITKEPETGIAGTPLPETVTAREPETGFTETGRQDTGKVIIKEPENGIADTGKPETVKTRGPKAGIAATSKPEKTIVKEPETIDDDTGDECR